MFTFILLSSFSGVFSQQTAVTKDGRTVILYNDGTWKYATSEESSLKNQILPEINKFLSKHQEFGIPIDVESIPDWAQGKRQKLKVKANGKSRSLLFYVKEQEVVTVYEVGANGREKIWGEYQKDEPFIPVTRETSESLPAYTVLYSNKMISSRKFGDILIPSFSRQTPAELREKNFHEIAKKEGLDNVSFYSSEDAYKANISASFAKSHPNALRNGFLGSLQNGKFIAGETLYP